MAPAISSSRVPVPARLYIALSIAALITPTVEQLDKNLFSDFGVLIPVIMSESLTGLLFGLAVRLIFLALEVIGEVISMCIGLTNNMGASVDGMDPTPILTSILSISALTLLFVMDLHHKVIGGIADSYTLIPLGSIHALSSSLREVVDIVSEAFYIVIRIAFPFIFFSIVINLSFGFINKIIPQFPSFFMSPPFIVFGGLIVLYITILPGSLVFIHFVESNLNR